jgi:polar amino acid transport system substrate-binding protein
VLRIIIMLLLCVCVQGAQAAGIPYPKKPEPQAEEARVIRIAADLWCPINCTPLEAQEGIGIDLARKIFEPLGYTVDYMVVPWARALEDVRSGKIDAVIGANHTDDPTLVLPKEGVAAISDDFFVSASDDWKFTGIESLAGKRLGVIKDYGYNDDIAAHIAAHERDSGIIQVVGGGDALEQNIRKLLARRIDVIVEAKPVMDYMQRRLGVQDKLRWAGGILQGNVYLAFSPAKEGSAELARLFDEGMARLRAAGDLDAMYAVYPVELPGATK